MEGLPDEALAQVAAYFQALSEPTRLQILNLLREREHSVGDLAQRCGFSAANISRHLSLLTQHGLVQRTSRGNSAIYSIADPCAVRPGVRQHRAQVRPPGRRTRGLPATGGSAGQAARRLNA